MPSSDNKPRRKRGRPPKERVIRIVPERREAPDPRRLARALLHLAQMEFDAQQAKVAADPEEAASDDDS